MLNAGLHLSCTSGGDALTDAFIAKHGSVVRRVTSVGEFLEYICTQSFTEQPHVVIGRASSNVQDCPPSPDVQALMPNMGTRGARRASNSFPQIVLETCSLKPVLCSLKPVTWRQRQRSCPVYLSGPCRGNFAVLSSHLLTPSPFVPLRDN